MARSREIPRADVIDVYDENDGVRSLIIRIFHRALLDAITPGHIQKHIKREAAAWLLSNSTKTYSAQWWAKEASLEYILAGCKKVLLNKEKEKFYADLSADIFRRRFGYRYRTHGPRWY